MIGDQLTYLEVALLHKEPTTITDGNTADKEPLVIRNKGTPATEDERPPVIGGKRPLITADKRLPAIKDKRPPATRDTKLLATGNNESLATVDKKEPTVVGKVASTTAIVLSYCF